MKTGLKIVSIGCGGLLLLIIGVVVFIAVLLFSTVNDPQFTAVIEHGRAFGKTTDNQGCINEGLRRAEKLRTVSPDSIEFWAESAWTGSCLETSAENKGFCEGVPTMSEEFRNALKEKAYEEQMCRKTRFGQFDVNCKSVYLSKQKHCWGKN